MSTSYSPRLEEVLPIFSATITSATSTACAVFELSNEICDLELHAVSTAGTIALQKIDVSAASDMSNPITLDSDKCYIPNDATSSSTAVEQATITGTNSAPGVIKRVGFYNDQVGKKFCKVYIVSTGGSVDVNLTVLARIKTLQTPAIL